MKATTQRTLEPTNDRRWQAVVDRDGSLDGTFVFGVSSTGIFCRPSCPAKRPRRQNVSFFDHALQAEQAGYRACLRCRPKAVDGNPQSALVRAMCRYIEQHIEDPLTLSLLAKEFRRSSFHLQRTFKSVLGVSPKAYIDACRLRQVKQNLQAGHSVTTALYAAGYGSSSRLYERTATQLGMTPEKYRRGAVAAVVRYTIASSPLGRMLIAATDKGICAIQFADSDQQLAAGIDPRVPFRGPPPRRCRHGRMARQPHPPHSGARDQSFSSARHPSHRFSAASLGSSATNSPRRNALLQRRSQEDRYADGKPRRRPSLRYEPGRSSNSLPPRSAPGWRIRGLSLGHSAQGTATRVGAATVETRLAPSQAAKRFNVAFGWRSASALRQLH